jgi:cytidylate kinase
MNLDRPPPLVTISASYGAGGSLVGPQLAARLRVPFLDRAIPVAVSNRLHVPLGRALTQEHPTPSLLKRLVAQASPAVQMFAGAPLSVEATHADDEWFREATEEVLREHAATGAVILGRAGAVVLRDHPDALHVRLDGPRERRIAQAMRRRGISREVAAAELHSSDLSREAYVKHWYRVDPSDPTLYHLVIDTTRIDVGESVEIITVAVRPVAAASQG